MKNLCACMGLVLLAGCQNTSFFDTQTSGTHYYVAPTGNDANAGTRHQPFATPHGAQVAVRKSVTCSTTPITVHFAPGTYTMAEPLVFTDADSGRAAVTYCADKAGTVIFSAGQRIEGWTPLSNNLWVATVPWLKGMKEPFTQLYVNDERRPCARTPNEGAYFYTRRLTFDTSKPQQHAQECIGFSVNKDDVLPWISQPQVRIALFHNWVNSYNRIAQWDARSNRVVFGRSAGIFFLGPEIRYYVENSLEALDAAGEWYADTQRGKLYYKPLPQEDMRRVEIIVPRLTARMLQMEADYKAGRYVENLHFRNISFRHTDADLTPDYRHSVQGAHTQRGAITARGLRNSSIVNCEFTLLGEHGVSLQEGCASNLIQHCHLHALGGGGIYLSEGAPATTNLSHHTTFNRVDNNFIHDGGAIFRAACGVFMGGSASYNTITHNEICDLSWMGIHQGWSWTGRAPAYSHHNEIAYNHIHHLGNGVLNDIGGIYTLGVSTGTILHHNRIHDISRFERGREGYGGWGIYLDAGSSEITVTQNIAYNTRDGALHLHNDSYPYGDIITNNIFACSQDGELIRGNIKDSEKRHVTFERNIVYTESSNIYNGSNWKTNSNFFCDNNLYWSATTNAPVFGQSCTWEQWQAAGLDRHSRIADPRFLAIDSRDFTLRPDSPAFALGFKAIDIAPAGLYGDRAWRHLPSRYPHRAIERAMPPPPPDRLIYSFDEESVGEQPDDGFIHAGEGNASIRVSIGGVNHGQCLRIVDAPEVKHAHDPHLFYRPGMTNGIVTETFWLNHAPGALVAHEWRDWPANRNLISGPQIRVNGQGDVTASGKKCLTLTPHQWHRITIICGLGSEASGTWELRITPANQAEQCFAKLPCSPGFKKLDWLGFMSLETKATTFAIDDLTLHRVTPPSKK